MKLPILITLTILFHTASGQSRTDSLFEDISSSNKNSSFFRSDKVDFIQINSSITNGVKIGIVVYKPARPSRILLMSHGWHQSVTPPQKNAENLNKDFLTIQVDMRGRKYSTGKADCNGYELYDFYDAYQYVVKNYGKYISDASQVYYLGGSGGGGNGYGLLGKFPDLFCSAVISCGPSDYAAWFKQDTLGEFRDDMIPWIGSTPAQNMQAYQSRSGITTVKNLLTPVYICHGDKDVRVPVNHSRNYYQTAVKLGKEIRYLELKGVGGVRQHWENITPKQTKEQDDFQAKGLLPRKVPQLPEKGELIVAGYLVTKKFSVFLNTIDAVGRIKYDLKTRQIKFISGTGKIIWN